MRSDDSTLRIPLSRGAFALIDAADAERVSRRRWHLMRGQSGVRYALTGGGLSMHRLILGLSKGDATHVDHINGDGLDNRRSNLRTCTRGQNAMNSRKPRRARHQWSKYKGVCRHERKWQAYVHIDGRMLNLGLFETEYDAACARDAAARWVYGEFAWVELAD
jgi:hypothetical protein